MRTMLHGMNLWENYDLEVPNRSNNTEGTSNITITAALMDFNGATVEVVNGAGFVDFQGVVDIQADIDELDKIHHVEITGMTDDALYVKLIDIHNARVEARCPFAGVAPYAYPADLHLKISNDPNIDTLDVIEIRIPYEKNNHGGDIHFHNEG